MEKHTVSRLVGSPPGYVGYDEGGQLTEMIRRKPYTVVLFDEIEKAHPDVFNILLQILDDGILTDSKGRRVSFKNTIIIMTSNVGARRMTEQTVSFGFGTASSDQDDTRIREKVLEDLKALFRPEFLNRIDDVIVFSKLTQENIEEIACRMLNSLRERMAAMEITIEATPHCISAIAKVGFDPVYGARPLRRAIQSKIEDALAEKLLEGAFHAGDTVVIDYSNDTFIFQTS